MKPFFFFKFMSGTFLLFGGGVWQFLFVKLSQEGWLGTIVARRSGTWSGGVDWGGIWSRSLKTWHGLGEGHERGSWWRGQLPPAGQKRPFRTVRLLGLSPQDARDRVKLSLEGNRPTQHCLELEGDTPYFRDQCLDMRLTYLQKDFRDVVLMLDRK